MKNIIPTALLHGDKNNWSGHTCVLGMLIVVRNNEIINK